MNVGTRRVFLRSASAAALGLSAFPLGWAVGAESKRKRLLYFTASVGFEHPPVVRKDGKPSCSDRVMTEFGKRGGFDVECTKDGRVFDGDLDRYDAFAFYTCGNLLQPGLHNTPPMTPEGKKRLLDAIAAGKGFVGFHSAADTFHSQGPKLDPYIAMLGGEFITHGATQEAALFLVPPFPGASNLACAEGLSFTDEWYALKNFAKDLRVILVQETKYLKGDCYRRPDYPSTWARKHGKGRVFYTSLGHPNEIWTNPFFQAITIGGLAWALGNAQADVKPNLDKVAPHANQLKT
jgi:type 1 glutamine amidotransferase